MPLPTRGNQRIVKMEIKMPKGTSTSLNRGKIIIFQNGRHYCRI